MITLARIYFSHNNFMLLKNSTSFHFPLSLFELSAKIFMSYMRFYLKLFSFLRSAREKVNFSLNIQRKFLRHDYFSLRVTFSFFCVKKPQSHCTPKSSFEVAKCQNPILSIHNLWCVRKWVNWKERWWLNNHIECSMPS
jgi:hypothetical protein